MTKSKLAERWFKAASRHRQDELDALLEEGADIDARDHQGYTALHYALTPFGGSPDLFVHLVERGADINIRGNDGLSAIDFGAKHVTSGMESNMIGHARDWAFLNGYRVETTRVREAADLWGTYVISRSKKRELQGTELHIDKKGIDTDLIPLRLELSGYRLAKGGRVILDGDHAGELVTVTLDKVDDRHLVFEWVDGVTYGFKLLLVRKPER